MLMREIVSNALTLHFVEPDMQVRSELFKCQWTPSVTS